MAGNFEKTNVDWQLQLLQMRIAEWFDRILAPPDRQSTDPKAFNWILPDWFLQSAFWTMTALLAVWVIWQLVTLLWPYLRTGQFRRRRAIAKPTATAGELLTGSEWLQRSRKLSRQGNYREACRALYLGTLQILHDRNIVPSQLSRTDGEYLRTLQTLAKPQPYQWLFRTHEQLCFSDHEISLETFQACERAYREIETL
jgi:hypothetical protein